MTAQPDPLLPCATCPWRVDKDASAIPRYNHEKACNLMNTVGDNDAFRPIMACHHSGDTPIPCKGYLAREGWSNISVRLLLAMGKIENPKEVMQACERSGIELHESYRDVLSKLSNGARG
jgi:Family of unknown function (DUF6283)